MWQKVKVLLKYAGAGFALFSIFLFLTFPFQRLGPKISSGLETLFSSFTGGRTTCSIQSFDFHFPLGVEWEHLSCSDTFGNVLVNLGKTSATLLPGYQKVSGVLEGGSFLIKSNAGIRSAPSFVEGTMNDVALKNLSPLISSLISRVSPAIRDLKIEGSLQGNFEIPLQSLATKPGSIDITIKNFKLPQQSTLNLIGLKDLPFSKATIKATSSAGKLTISDISFISDHLSGKVEGSMDLNDDLALSTPNLSLKWNVQKSDALLSTPVGSFLASSPCPSPDSQGFCSRRVTRMQDFKLSPF